MNTEMLNGMTVEELVNLREAVKEAIKTRRTEVKEAEAKAREVRESEMRETLAEGNSVRFQYGKETSTGTVKRLNEKSVTVEYVTEDGETKEMYRKYGQVLEVLS